MAHTLQQFHGTYTIRFGSQYKDFPVQVEAGCQLLIGTGQHEARESDGIRVGIAILDPQGQRIFPAAGDPPALAYLVEGTLNGSTYWLDPSDGLPKLLAYQVALMEVRRQDGGIYRAPTVTIFVGDPENAGVWGAEDSEN